MERPTLMTFSASTARLAATSLTLTCVLFCSQALAAQSSNRTQPLQPPAGSTGLGQKTSPTTHPEQPAAGQDKESASKPASAGEAAASPSQLKLGPLDPATPPKDLPKDRPVIGLALGGGAALSLTDIGVLEWLEEHRIPVDVIAGTSMGSIIGALYATGHTPEQMKHLLTETSVDNVFRIDQAYTARSFRRREDSRDVPNAITVGLAHGVSFRNSLLSDNGLNELLDKEFLRYNDQTDFNNLPIPFRCQATDLNAAQTVTFSRGSLQDAVRASASIPGVFRPFQLNGHEYVDGAILENLPTPDVKAMHADVILAVSIGLAPVATGDLNSILGVLQRAFAVGIEANERRDRRLANVVIQPDVAGFTSNDYLRTQELAIRGYLAAEANKATLIKYSLSRLEWEAYLVHRDSKIHGAPGPVFQVKISAPNDSVKAYANRKCAPLVDQPVDTEHIEKLLADLRSDGRYDADYTVGYPDANSDRPIILVTISDKKTGPPFLDIGLNIAAQSGGVTRANVDTILVQQDLGGYGSELRTKIDVGFSTLIASEYYRKLDSTGFFVAPRANLERQPFYIYTGNLRLSERQYETGGGGIDFGWGDGRDQEVRLGYQLQNIQWYTTTGSDGLPDFNGNAQTVRLRYVYDSQDRALVPRFGVRSVTEIGYLFGTPNSPSTPQFHEQIEFARTLGQKNTFLMNMEAATMFNHDVAQPFRYTLGGPIRLSASSIDQYRGTDYFLITPGYIRQIRSLGAPLNSSLSLGGTFEVGQMRAPDAATITRYDAYFGVVAETPLGVITVAPAFGNAGERKLVFTIGRIF